jgi:hypothetical protein
LLRSEIKFAKPSADITDSVDDEAVSPRTTFLRCEPVPMDDNVPVNSVGPVVMPNPMHRVLEDDQGRIEAGPASTDKPASTDAECYSSFHRFTKRNRCWFVVGCCTGILIWGLLALIIAVVILVPAAVSSGSGDGMGLKSGLSGNGTWHNHVFVRRSGGQPHGVDGTPWRCFLG